MKKDNFVIDPEAIAKCRAIESPMVSIGVLTYNQKNYIGMAIESILMQDVDFDYEIVIADDCSTDGTRNVLKYYAQKYPNVIRLIFQEKNVGIDKNSDSLKKACKGRYRAVQEGDDYWVDPFRLQKQVDFLENNRDYVAVCGLLAPIDEKGKPTKMPWGGLQNNYVMGGEYKKSHFESGKLPGHVGTWLSYNYFHVINEETFNRYTSYDGLPGDRRSPLFALHYGRVMVMPQVFMMRRFLWNSSTSYVNTFKQGSTPLRVFKWALKSQKMDDEFLKTGLNMLPIMDRMFLSIFREAASKPSKVNLSACIEVCFISQNKRHHTALFWSHFMNRVKKKIKTDGLIKGTLKGIKKIFKTLFGVFKKK